MQSEYSDVPPLSCEVSREFGDAQLNVDNESVDRCNRSSKSLGLFIRLIPCIQAFFHESLIMGHAAP
jgi:hypothetical protein